MTSRPRTRSTSCALKYRCSIFVDADSVAARPSGRRPCQCVCVCVQKTQLIYVRVNIFFYVFVKCLDVDATSPLTFSHTYTLILHTHKKKPSLHPLFHKILTEKFLTFNQFKARTTNYLFLSIYLQHKKREERDRLQFEVITNQKVLHSYQPEVTVKRRKVNLMNRASLRKTIDKSWTNNQASIRK